MKYTVLLFLLFFVPTFLFRPLRVHAQFFGIDVNDKAQEFNVFTEPTVTGTEPTVDPKTQKQQVKCVKRQNKNAKTIRKAPRRIKAHQKLIDGFNKDIDKQIDDLEKLRCDVSRLRRDQSTLERLYGDMQKEWSREYQKYADMLERGQNFSCLTEREMFVEQNKKAVIQLGESVDAYKRNNDRINNFMNRDFKKDIANITCG